MSISLIAAVAADGTIGRDGGMPWRLPADLAHFKKVTVGHPIIMGRTTFESIGGALPGRLNIVITTTTGWLFDDGVVCHDMESALDAATAADEDAFIIGGAQIYAQALRLDVVDQLVLSHIRLAPGGDTYFPHMDWTRWRETSRLDHHDSDPAFEIVTYQRALASSTGE